MMGFPKRDGFGWGNPPTPPNGVRGEPIRSVKPYNGPKIHCGALSVSEYCNRTKTDFKGHAEPHTAFSIRRELERVTRGRSLHPFPPPVATGG